MDARTQERSDKVIAAVWSHVLQLHEQERALISVTVAPNGLATLQPIYGEDLEELIGKLARTEPAAAAFMSMPYQPELVRVIYQEEHTGRTRILSRPVFD